ncbi:MAG TPA: cupin domain-containing protein [Acetobacteraceae bacterium]|jgi:quercetin dioxygenase-like cupin family protein|nr:cupin domain-containing protein [Acetobacteraceae bacterium]
MLAFDLQQEQRFDRQRHVEKILGKIGEGDVTVACWEPGQVSPNHLHPNATEIYFCFQGGGLMRTPAGTVEVKPGGFVVHPRGELHEYINGPERTLLFRVRYGDDMSTRSKDWPTNPDFVPKPEDSAWFAEHPNG